ncbi:Qat anti-phage system associated protein QatB [Aquabacterium sp.]|uniref:Qat anti-phage system associated protein QatB n=1 Tax=Aquabacterium sp. TaxID=1872578 RepID=UPI003783C04C
MGGSGQAANRMRASTRAGAGLVSFLQQVGSGATAEVRRWVSDLLASAPSADAVVDAIVEAIMPPGGSTDEEAIRDSMAIALSDLMVLSPDCDPLRMNADNTWTLMQLYLSQEVCSRLRFDMGQAFESAKLTPALAVQREMEMRQFVRNEIGVQLAELRRATPNPSQHQLDGLMRETLRLTFQVYEGLV